MKRIRKNISLTDADEARLDEAVRKDRGASFSHWLIGLGHARADELGIESVDHFPKSSQPAARAVPKRQSKKKPR